MSKLTVSVDRKDTYEVIIEEGLLARVGKLLGDLMGEYRVLVITDTRVGQLYGTQIADGLGRGTQLIDILKVVDGESSKSPKVAIQLIGQMLMRGGRRQDVVLALGGGVITDLAGFVAATYMRGIPYVNVPTSLIAQLDASIGGKVAVDHPLGKNLIGAFYHPRAVYIDPCVLATLPQEEIRNGLAEAIKVAIIHSEPLFEFIESNHQIFLDREIHALMELVYQAAAAKIALISPDPYEHELKRALNFGHGIGHALETELAYQGIKHGQAVSIGMAVATRMAEARGLCSTTVAHRILGLLENIGLSTETREVNPEAVWRSMQVLRAIRGGSLHFVVPTDIGAYAIIEDVSQDDIVDYLGGWK
jgi:3-dehydroquinate synthase